MIKLLKRTEVAELLKVHPSTVDRLRRAGVLSTLKAGGKFKTVRFSEEEVLALFKKEQSK